MKRRRFLFVSPWSGSGICARFEGEGGDGGGGGGEPWYAKDGFTEEQLPTVKRYKTRESWNNAHFEQRKTIAQHEAAAPPDATKLKPEEFMPKLREWRARAGGIIDSKAVKVNFPDDLKGYIEGHLPNLAKEIAEDAAEIGMTQIEIDAKVEKLAKTIRTRMENEGTAAADAKRAQDEAMAEADKKLTELWGDKKEAQDNNSTLFAHKMDELLFAVDNEALSEEEIADRGGLLAQDLRKLDPDSRQRMTRLFNFLWNKLYAESETPSTGNRTTDNLYADRLAKVKAQYPKRPELWDQMARDTSIEL